MATIDELQTLEEKHTEKSREPRTGWGPHLADSSDLTHSTREAMLHLIRVAKLALRVAPLMGIIVFAFFATSTMAPAIASFTFWLLILTEGSSATIEFTWFRMKSAIHWVISAVVVGALCIWLHFFPISAGSGTIEFAISIALMASFAGVREVVYEMMVHNADKPCVQRFCESLFGGVFYSLTIVVLIGVNTSMMCASVWWPETDEAGTWQSYLWTCLIVPIVLKAGSAMMGSLGEIMIAAAGDYCADLIRCEFAFCMDVLYGLIAGWVIFSSPTFTQSWITLLSDITIELLLQATTNKKYRAAWRAACASKKVQPYGVGAAGATHDEETGAIAEVKPEEKLEDKVEKEPPADNLTSQETGEKDPTVTPSGDGGGGATEATPQKMKKAGRVRRMSVEMVEKKMSRKDIYDPMLGEDPLDELETTVVSIAVRIGSMAIDSSAIAIMILFMHLYDRGEDTSPINLLVLLVRFLAYAAEGIVLIIGAQHDHGKLLTYASLEKRWELLLDHSLASMLFYAILATNTVLFILLGPVVFIVNAEDRAGSL